MKTGKSRRLSRAAYLVIGILIAASSVVVVLNLAGSERRIEREIVHRYALSDPQFRREISALLGPPLIPGNRVSNFENGEQIFPAMLEAIRAAKRSITFESYIYWSGSIGLEFAEALRERARAGVPVHIMLDWAGSQKIDNTLLETMRDAGIEVQLFHPLGWYHIGRMNNRTHRKLLVVDGSIGFTGGVGIADPWLGNATRVDRWRDSHYRIEGPVVAQMQAAFLDNWIKTTGVVLQGEAYFPALAPVGDVDAQVFTSSPSGGGDSMQLMYLLSLAAATRSVDLSAAYFVPDDLTRKVLIAVLHRGVRVRILVPGANVDWDVVRQASRDGWGELLEAGAEIHEYGPSMFHCKLLIVDQLLVSVGSTNFDNRSFRLNDEANLNLYDAQFAAQLTAVFEADLSQAHRVTLETWNARPWHMRLKERVSDLFSPML